jgi:hypothetical protein
VDAGGAAGFADVGLAAPGPAPAPEGGLDAAVGGFGAAGGGFGAAGRTATETAGGGFGAEAVASGAADEAPGAAIAPALTVELASSSANRRANGAPKQRARPCTRGGADDDIGMDLVSRRLTATHEMVGEHEGERHSLPLVGRTKDARSEAASRVAGGVGQEDGGRWRRVGARDA